MFTFPHISLGKTSHRVACFKGVGRGNPECGRRGAWTYRWAAIMPTVRDRYLLSPFCYKPTLPDTWNKFLSPVQWRNTVNRGFPVDPLLLSHHGLGSRMKAAPWPKRKKKAEVWGWGGRWGRDGSWEVKSRTHGQQQRAVSCEQTRLFLTLSPGNAALWLNAGNSDIVRLSQ